LEFPNYLSIIINYTLEITPAHSEEPRLDKKRKRLDELLSSSTFAPKDVLGEPSAPNTSEVEIFDALDS
jgi:hypothetical protein